ncbi:tetratricopeptide repeat protein [Leptospira weilii]|uniref:tetratricopeptide repeat protein n=1 Tax=Leptospira weilii TaxID=28184 RepID=UPI0007748123|nr:tetratricopeptide repeat protein [Leptospira weilii]
MKGTFVYLFILLFAFDLLGEEFREPYQSIKSYIERGNLKTAQESLSDLLKIYPDDAVLQLYQNKLWIAYADSFFQKGSINLALSYYSKVDKEWANNPHVKSQIRKCLNNFKSVSEGRNLIQKFPTEMIENTETPVSTIPNEGILSGLEEIKDQISNVQWITFLNLGILSTLIGYSVFFRKK